MPRRLLLCLGRVMGPKLRISALRVLRRQGRPLACPPWTVVGILKPSGASAVSVTDLEMRDFQPRLSCEVLII